MQAIRASSLSAGRCFTSALLLVLAVAGGTPAQKKTSALAPQKAQTPLGEVRILDKKTAANLVKKLKKSVLSRKAKRAPLADRLQELEGLETMQHEQLVPILHKVMTGDPSTVVRIKAARALIAQPASKVMKVVAAQLKDRAVLGEGALAEPMIRFASHYGAPKSVWKRLRRCFVDIGVNAQKVLIDHYGKKQDWDSVPLLLANLDAPAPKDVNAADNPPAAYWKKRWDKWRVFRPHVRAALRSFFGRDFESAKAAAAWIKEQGGLDKLRRAAAKRAKKAGK